MPCGILRIRHGAVKVPSPSYVRCKGKSTVVTPVDAIDAHLERLEGPEPEVGNNAAATRTCWVGRMREY